MKNIKIKTKKFKMDNIIDENQMLYKPEKYEIFYDFHEFQNQCCFSDDEFFFINEKKEDDLGFFPRIKEIVKSPTDTIEKIKKSNSISPKFQSYCFFNPKIKNNEQIIAGPVSSLWGTQKILLHN